MNPARAVPCKLFMRVSLKARWIVICESLGNMQDSIVRNVGYEGGVEKGKYQKGLEVGIGLCS